jgi:hypothetical protein
LQAAISKTITSGAINFVSFINFVFSYCKGNHNFNQLLTTPTYNNKKLLTALGLLFVTAFLAYWQVITFSNCLKWDMVDQYFPWRYHVVSCLRNGELPLWNPYNFAGYPIHADPQSGAWYMPLWLFALLGNYTAHANAVEVFLHIWLAGVGMYLLTRRFYGNQWIAIIASASYIGCGLLVGNAQHFTYIISACWLPFVLLYFTKTIQDKGYRNPLLLALFLWLFFTGGYPAFFIITVYILGIAFVLHWIKNRAETKELILKTSLAGVVFVLLTSPSIASFALYWNDTTRSGSVSLADALFGPFRVADLQSFFNPMLSAVNKQNTGTDISMMNGYFGLIPLVFLGLIIPFYKQLSRREVFILITTLVCLLAAFGDTFFIPVREALYHLPGLGIFRFPAIFRLFAIVGFILTASFIMKLYEDKGERSGEWKWLFGSLGFVALVIVALSFKNTVWGSVASDFKAFHFIWADMPGHSAAALLGGTLQLAFLALVFFFRKNLKALAFIAIANSIVFVQLNMGTTVINKESPQVIEDFIAKMPQGPTIDNNRLMGNTHFDAPAPLWRNLGIFYRESSYDGNNPFRLKNFAEFESFNSKGYADKSLFYCLAAVLEFINNNHSSSIGILADSKGGDTLIMQHNMAKFWDINVQVGPKKQTIEGGIITVIPLQDGTNSISCEYNPPYVSPAFLVSIITLLSACAALELQRRKKQTRLKL